MKKIIYVATLLTIYLPTLVKAEFIAIGTAGLTGVYFPTGGAVCRILNEGYENHGMRCLVDPTGGSIDNIFKLQDGTIDFGVVQSDVQYNAYNGSGPFEGSPSKNLRTVFSLHAEPFTLLVHKNSGIESFSDLAGKHVNIGNPKSGHRGIMELLMQEAGLTVSDFASATEHDSLAMADEICAGNIDAMVFAVGHPASIIKEVTTYCDVILLPITGDSVNRLVQEYPYYQLTEIPANTYPNQDEPIQTFGVIATLVTDAEVPEETVYRLTHDVLKNLNFFKILHPALENLDLDSMTKSTIAAPIHPGAKRAFQELGLIQK